MEKRAKKIILGFVLALFMTLFISSKPLPVFAASFTLSPMNQTITLTPGETYEGSFKINNSSTAKDFEYRLETSPFWVNDKYDVIYESHGNYNLITNWIRFAESTGKVAPSSSTTVNFEIAVPASATPGGQYLIIRVADRAGATSGVRSDYSLGHVIYAEVSGEGIKRSASVSEVALPRFVLSGKQKDASSDEAAAQKIQTGVISSSAKITNTGNVMGTAKVTMEAYPLFSNELKYSNLDSPATYKILPDASRTVVLSWENSPKLGIFKVLNKVYFNDELLKTTDAFVLLIPLWLLVLIIIFILAIISLIIYIKINQRNKNATPSVPQSIVEE